MASKLTKAHQTVLFSIFQKYGEISVRSLTLEIEEQRSKKKLDNELIAALEDINTIAIEKFVDEDEDDEIKVIMMGGGIDPLNFAIEHMLDHFEQEKDVFAVQSHVTFVKDNKGKKLQVQLSLVSKEAMIEPGDCNVIKTSDVKGRKMNGHSHSGFQTPPGQA